jgi:cation diffusion facilitator family transporter
MVQTYALKASNSVAVSADRMHYITDLLSNFIAFVGIAGAAFGFLYLDGLAGLIIGFWFVWGAIKVLREAADHLMDHALPDEDIEVIQNIMLLDPKILGVHQIRTRIMGPYIMIQMHCELEPYQSLKDAHTIIISAENRLLERYENADILIHPDPKGYAEPHGGVFSENAHQHPTPHSPKGL